MRVLRRLDVAHVILSQTVEEEVKSKVDIIEAASPPFHENEALLALAKESVTEKEELDGGNVLAKIKVSCEICTVNFNKKKYHDMSC